MWHPGRFWNSCYASPESAGGFRIPSSFHLWRYILPTISAGDVYDVLAHIQRKYFLPGVLRTVLSAYLPCPKKKYPGLKPPVPSDVSSLVSPGTGPVSAVHSSSRQRYNGWHWLLSWSHQCITRQGQCLPG